MAKLSKAQQEVLDRAKYRIDFARTHSFCDWWRKNESFWKYKEATDAEVYEILEERTRKGWIGTLEWEMKHYEMERDGIDPYCHASSATIKKLETLGLIEIIYDSNGEYYGFDTIKILNY